MNSSISILRNWKTWASVVIVVFLVGCSPGNKFEELKAEAEKGDAEAQAMLGQLYEHGTQFSMAVGMGLGAPQDYAEAVKWYRKAADQGFAPAQLGMGRMYYDGVGVAQDFGEALRWYRKGVGRGDGGARARLGQMYEKGQGVPQDSAEALKWFRMEALEGDAEAKHKLGEVYEKDQGVPLSDAEATQVDSRGGRAGRP